MEVSDEPGTPVTCGMSPQEGRTELLPLPHTHTHYIKPLNQIKHTHQIKHIAFNQTLKSKYLYTVGSPRPAEPRRQAAGLSVEGFVVKVEGQILPRGKY